MALSSSNEKIDNDKTKQKLDEIAYYIRNRKIDDLKKLFPESRHDVVYYMFFKYDKNHNKHNGDEEIIYEDNEYIVVRSTRAFNTYRGEYYHGIQVIGVDPENNQPWIHRLTWIQQFEDEKEMKQLTKEKIKQYMGFTKEFERNKVFLHMKLDETVRVQGDLTIRKVTEINITCNHCGKCDHCQHIDQMMNNSRQVNARMANHLIIMGRATLLNEWSTMDFYVVQPTRCFVIHDEHQNCEFGLMPGTYRFGLLRRHQNS